MEFWSKFNSDFSIALDSDCILCPREFHIENGIKRPTKATFDKYLTFFLSDIPQSNCAKAGKAAYSNVRRRSVMKNEKKTINSLKHIYRPYT